MILRPFLTVLALLAIAAPAAAHEPLRAGDAGTREEASSTLDEAERLLDGRGVRTGKELTPVLMELARRMEALPSGERREARAILARPTNGEEQPGDEPYDVRAVEHSHCTEHFCVHWVTRPDNPAKPDPDVPPLADGDGDGVPDYVETMAGVFENVYSVEVEQMGWRPPPPDGTRGGDVDKVDVYIQQLGDQGNFGYAAVDGGQATGNSQPSYLVMDNDYITKEYKRYMDPLRPMQVTAAHEFNHVLQFGYDVLQDLWMFESTAVWMEDKVYDDINDYVFYLTPWVRHTRAALTAFNPGDMSDPLNYKVYGDAVWNRWIDEHYGQDSIRVAWEKSLTTNPRSFGPEAYEAMLQTRGTTFFDAFTSFVTDTAEWNSSAGAFEEGTSWPPVKRVRRLDLAPGGREASTQLDHLGYAFVNVTPTRDERIKLIGSLPRGTRGAFAVIGREGDKTTGVPTVHMVRLPNGGHASVEVPNPGRFTRMTAALINADARQIGYSSFLNDWLYARDSQLAKAHVSNDYTPPRVRKRSPGPGAKVSPRAPVVVTFNEPMQNVSTKTIVLVGRGGKKVPVRVSYDAARRQARLVPKKPLAARTRHYVKIGSTLVDFGDNELAAAERTWKFHTRSR
ncbi:MAG TPA: Ig-like domain-containing protein [Thermoleophilaceae bacterium]